MIRRVGEVLVDVDVDQPTLSNQSGEKFGNNSTHYHHIYTFFYWSC